MITEDIAEYRQSLRTLKLEHLVAEWRKVKKDLKDARSNYGGAKDTSPAEDEKWVDYLLATEYEEAHGGDSISAANKVFGSWENYEAFEEYYCGSVRDNLYFMELADKLADQLVAVNQEGIERLGKTEWQKQRRSKKYESRNRRVTNDDLGNLERLAALWDSGALSDQEFEEAKNRILGA